MIEILWLLAGVLGGVMLWRLEKHMITEDLTWCPTPRAILFIVLGSVTGGVLLFAAILVCTMELMTNTRMRDNWFTRPICKRKEE